MAEDKKMVLKNLKKRAKEQQPAFDACHIQEMSVFEIAKLIHELETYQIELELQNEDLRASEEKISIMRDLYIDLYDFAPIGYTTLSREGLITKSNLTFSTMLGIARSEIINQPLRKYIISEDMDIFHFRINEILAHQQTQYCELRLISEEKNPLWVKLDIVIREKSLNMSEQIQVTITDITKLKKAESDKVSLQNELHQTRKMEAMGLLTGGIAHDFNNILGIIMGYTELSKKRSIEIDSPVLDGYLETILTASNRAKSIVAKMLSFSRHSVKKDRPMLLNSAVNDDIKVLLSTFPASIDITLETDDKLPPVLMDASELNQLIINLSVNARDAMSDKGNLVVKIGWSKGLYSRCASCNKLVTGDWIELSVADNGSGIPKEVLDRIFDPFFTTKGVGKGTGLGLSVIHGIMHAHHGHIIVDSRPTESTTFRLLFQPCKEMLPEYSEDDQSLTSVPQGHHEKILVLDDEVNLTALLNEALTSHCYDVTVLNNSLEAFTFVKENPDEFDLIITDQTMPDMTGIEFINEIRSIRPQMPFVMLTGFSEHIDVEGANKINVQYMEKPVDIDNLVRLVDEIIKR